VLPIAIAARTTAAVGQGTDGVLEAVSSRDGGSCAPWREHLPAMGGVLAGVLRELWEAEALRARGCAWR